MVNYYPGAFPRSELHFGSQAPFHSITHSIDIYCETTEYYIYYQSFLYTIKEIYDQLFFTLHFKVSSVFNFPVEFALNSFLQNSGFLKTKVILKILKSYICHLLIKVCFLQEYLLCSNSLHELIKVLRLFSFLFSIFFFKKMLQICMFMTKTIFPLCMPHRHRRISNML